MTLHPQLLLLIEASLELLVRLLPARLALLCLLYQLLQLGNPCVFRLVELSEYLDLLIFAGGLCFQCLHQLHMMCPGIASCLKLLSQVSDCRENEVQRLVEGEIRVDRVPHS